MNRTEHLLFIAAEECAEVAQRLSKAARFGLTEIQPGQPLTNAERIVEEWTDLVGVMEMLVEQGAIEVPTVKMITAREIKKTKVEKFLAYSVECGTLQTETEGEV